MSSQVYLGANKKNLHQPGYYNVPVNQTLTKKKYHFKQQRQATKYEHYRQKTKPFLAAGKNGRITYCNSEDVACGCEEDKQLSYCSLWAPLYMDVTHLKTAKQK